MQPVLRDLRVIYRSHRMFPVHVAALGVNRLPREHPVPIELQARVKRDYPVRSRSEIAAGREQPDGRLLPEFALYPNHSDGRAFPTDSRIQRRDFSGRTVVDTQYAKRPASELAGEARAEFGIGYAAREE